jgi:hypothetical protein
MMKLFQGKISTNKQLFFDAGILVDCGESQSVSSIETFLYKQGIQNHSIE